MVTLTRSYRFSASHRLHAAVLSAEENAALYGKCNHPFGHGHNYSLEVTVEGQVDPRTGVILPASVLDELVQGHVLRLFASRNINIEVQHFSELVPTTENMVAVIGRILQDVWPETIGGRAALRRVYIRETGRNSFEMLLGGSSAPASEGVFVHAKSKIE